MSPRIRGSATGDVVKCFIFGASLSEPHINGTSVHEFYIIIIMVHRSREIYAQCGSMDIIAKYSIAHSHAWVTGCMYAVLI